METKSYDMVAEMPCYTVVNAYEKVSDDTGGAYESEAAMEARFIHALYEQGYEYLKTIKTEKGFKENLRKQMEKLNRGMLKDGVFSDEEWRRFYGEVLAKKSDGIEDKTAKFQEERRFSFTFDDGRTDNIKIFDDRNINNNSLQVINQYREDKAAIGKKVRYDVTVLVNGLPIVHIELKRRGVAIKEAFNQINRYSRDGFWGGDALFEWVQIFVISNGTHTKYYANTTRRGKVNESGSAATGSQSHTSETFEFTSYWSDAKNEPIKDIRDFVRTFFAQNTLRNLLAKYCVFTADRCLMVMRPYQIAATERILEKIHYAAGKKDILGKIDAGGYIWHSTGSGKTLTSFKTALLASQLDYVDKVMFVVDRQDLDDQTQREYDKFQKGCVAGTANTKALTAQLSDAVKSEKSKIVITTIQKLSIFVKENPPGSKHAGIYDKHVVIIFDECHRTQFGKMHLDIAKRFKKYQIFGFTGTPRLEENQAQAFLPDGATMTAQVFGDRLHSYTMADAIRDNNVLPFHIETIGWARPPEDGDGGESVEDRQPESPEEMALTPAGEDRIKKIVSYILGHYAAKTLRSKTYQHKAELGRGKSEKKTVNGFNSILAVNFIDDAKFYYSEFKRQIKELPEDHPCKNLKIATIFTAAANEAEKESGMVDGEGEVTALDITSKEFLEAAMADYNRLFPAQGAMGFSAKDGDTFHNYYLDISTRMKNRDLDLLIVVNMFLTGFDAKTLNTLWLDKNLRQHGLIQAFSRTNRILNSVKVCGNIICFRDLERETNEAIALFSDKDKPNDSEIIQIKTFEDYYSKGYNNYKGEHVKSYTELVEEITSKFPPDKDIEGDEAKEEFSSLFSELLKARNVLGVFDEFEDDKENKQILSDLDMQDYCSKYLDIKDEMEKRIVAAEMEGAHNDWLVDDGEEEDGEAGEYDNIGDDGNNESIGGDESLQDNEPNLPHKEVVFELELLRQFDVTFDYILMLIGDYHDADDEAKKPIFERIIKSIKASDTLRPKMDLIMEFIEKYDDSSKWQAFIQWRLEEDINELSERLGLDATAVREFVVNAIATRRLVTVGPDFEKIMPPVDLFGDEESADEAAEKRREVAEEMENLYNRYKDDYSATEGFTGAQTT